MRTCEVKNITYFLHGILSNELYTYYMYMQGMKSIVEDFNLSRRFNTFLVLFLYRANLSTMSRSLYFFMLYYMKEN